MGCESVTSILELVCPFNQCPLDHTALAAGVIYKDHPGDIFRLPQAEPYLKHTLSIRRTHHKLLTADVYGWVLLSSFRSHLHGPLIWISVVSHLV